MKKDFTNYCYFLSKASNYAVCIKPERKAIVDGETVTKDVGLRVEFNNKMLAVKKGGDGDVIIKFLRDKIEKEKALSPNARMIFEEKEEEALISEVKVKEALKNKDEEIAKLKAQIAAKK